LQVFVDYFERIGQLLQVLGDYFRVLGDCFSSIGRLFFEYWAIILHLGNFLPKTSVRYVWHSRLAATIASVHTHTVRFYSIDRSNDI
jgi:hypothetical protein